MLNDLKRYIHKDAEFTSALEAAAYTLIESTDEDIKAAFLDDIEARMIGIENDPEIKKLVDSIPPVDGDVSNMDVSQMVEEFIPDEEGDSMLESFDDDFVFESFDEDDDTVFESFEDDDDTVFESFEDDDDVLEADIEDVYYDGEYLAEDCDADTEFDCDGSFSSELDDIDFDDRDDLLDADDNAIDPDRIS